MVKVNVAEVKAKLSEYLALVAGGERVVICKHNRPVAELRAVEATRTEPRPVGGAAGRFTVPASFFEPLPDDLIAGFMGGPSDMATRVAEDRPVYTPVGEEATAMKVLLDTCTFLWLIGDASQVSKRALDLYRAPDHEVLLSVASVWEIATKYALGTLPLPEDPSRFIPAQREAHGIAALDITEEATLHQARLPWLHRDPFDRMIVSQAIVHGLTILTPDPYVTQYAARTVW